MHRNRTDNRKAWLYSIFFTSNKRSLTTKLDPSNITYFKNENKLAKSFSNSLNAKPSR